MKAVSNLLNDLNEKLLTMEVNADLVIENGEKELVKELRNLLDIVSEIRWIITGE